MITIWLFSLERHRSRQWYTMITEIRGFLCYKPILSLHFFLPLLSPFSLSFSRILSIFCLSLFLLAIFFPCLPPLSITFSLLFSSYFSYCSSLFTPKSFMMKKYAFLLFTSVFSLPVVLRNIPWADSMNSWEMATISFSWICHINTSVISLSIG